MTNTLTTNIKETIKQINNLEEVGADIVRVSVQTKTLQEHLKRL